MVCNVFRAIASGWDFTYMGDGALKLFDGKMYAITTNANGLRNVTSWIAMAFVLKESFESYSALYKDIVRACFALKGFKLCDRPPGECGLCVALRDMRQEHHYRAWLSTLKSWQEMMLPVKYTISDTMGFFHQFVRHQFPKASKNLCRGRLRCFSRQKNIEDEHFKPHSGIGAKEWYKAFNDIMLQAMNNPYKHLGGDLQNMIMDWFNANGQELAVAWFNKYWMCNSEYGGRWMICHFGSE